MPGQFVLIYDMKYFAGIIFGIGAALATLISALRASTVSDHVPMHWNLAGQVDRYGSRAEALWLMPGMMLGMALIFGMIGVISGKRLQVNATKAMNIVSAGIVVFLLVIHNTLLSQSKTDILTILPAMLCGLLLLMGFAIKGVEPNPFVGIRVSWTMNSPMVWRITHDRASKLWIAGGTVGLLLSFAGMNAAVPILIFTGCTLYPVLDSYRISKTV